MKLSIAILVSSILLRFDTPGPGRFYLFSAENDRWVVLMSGHTQGIEHVSKTVPRGGRVRIYFVEFYPDEPPATESAPAE